MNRRGFASSLLALALSGLFARETSMSAGAAVTSQPRDREAQMLEAFRKLEPAQRTAFLTLLWRLKAGTDIKPAAVDFFVACGREQPEAERMFDAIRAEHLCMRGVA